MSKGLCSQGISWLSKPIMINCTGLKHIHIKTRSSYNNNKKNPFWRLLDQFTTLRIYKQSSIYSAIPEKKLFQGFLY